MAGFCSKCGTKIQDGETACSSCGARVDGGNTNNAGTPIIVNVENKNLNNVSAGQCGVQKSKIVALLLCFFLGFLGAHRF